MINAYNLAVVLRALRGSEVTARVAPLNGPVTAVPPVRAAHGDDAHGTALRAAVTALLVTPTSHAVDSGDAGVHERVPESSAAGQRSAAAPPGHAPTTTAPAGNAAASAVVSLSSAGLTVRELLRETIGIAARPLIVPAAPLTSRAPEHAAPLAEALARTVRESGLFYEAHVAAWAAGRYPQPALEREPQAHWRQLPASFLPVPGATADEVANPTPSAVPTAAGGRMPDDVAQVVRQQLEVLDTRRLAIACEPWPGQRAELAFSEEVPDGHERDAHEAVAARVWTTRIDIETPHLGRVTAIVAVTGDGVRCRLYAANEDAADRLARGREAFTRALAAQALAIDECVVSRGRP